MNHAVAKGEFGIISAIERSTATQYVPCNGRYDTKQRELVPSTHVKIDDQKPLTLELTVDIEYQVKKRNKTEYKNADIKFFREPFVTTWIEALIMLFRQLPAEPRNVEAIITYQDMLDRRCEDKRNEPSNTTVMKESADIAFQAFMKDKPIKLNSDQMTSIAPQWCHVVMSSGLKSATAQRAENLCCAPEGMNIAMRVPEHMVAHLARHLHSKNESVKVDVNLQLFKGTSVLKSMVYKIETNNATIMVDYDHPFRQPHFHFESQGVAHLQEVLGVKFKT